MYDAIDLFAGPGGWDVAAEALDLRTLGVEFDQAACETRRAAGLVTVQTDVRTLNPLEFPVAGFIASPPCQTFSTAGGGSGRAQLDLLTARVLNASWFADDLADERSGLVLEPVRWICRSFEEGTPYRWIAMEQVPTVLPLWKAYVTLLERMGYSAVCGNLQAEQYGVPQTRKRAVLIAALDGPVSLPRPTHSRYYPRNPEKLDVGVKKWVSMAEALGWDCDVEVRSNYGTGGDPTNRGTRTGDQPFATVTSKIDRVKVSYRTSTQPNATLRSSELAAPTIAFGNDANSAGWVFAGAGVTAVTAGQVRGELAQPAHTITGKGTAVWCHERPATTVNCDARISRPGRHDPAESGSQQKDAIRVTVQEAGILQSFPSDYPWQGTKTKQYQQVGNAIPPGLASPVLVEAVLAGTWLRAAA